MPIVPTDLRPDIGWWDDQQKSLVLAELTISYETNFEAAAERKEEKYMKSWLLEPTTLGMRPNSLL